MKLRLEHAGVTATFGLIAIIISGCSAGGRKASTLDRQTALALLHEQEAKLTDKLNGKAVFDINTHPVIMPASGWDQKRGAMTIEFLDRLAKVGVLEKATSIPAAKGVVLYTYPIIPQENVSSAYANTQNEVVLITIAKPVIKEVTGISQEGSRAVVEASISTEPTALYSRIVNEIRDLLAECDSFPVPQPYFCTRWPFSTRAINKKQSRSFDFARYDDGWRLQQ
jgi:hypothetical protein